MTLRLATRGSELALWQARRTSELLGGAEIVVVESSGDRDRETELARFGSIGIFTVEVDRAVLDGRADVGVHSLKDMTTTLQEGVLLAGVLERDDHTPSSPVTDSRWTDSPRRPRRDGLPRRGAMLRAGPASRWSIRGNVGTRLPRSPEASWTRPSRPCGPGSPGLGSTPATC